VKTIFHHFSLVDIDDGYASTEVAYHLVSLLESVGASSVIFKYQACPGRCGHVDSKLLLEEDTCLANLHKVLAARK